MSGKHASDRAMLEGLAVDGAFEGDDVEGDIEGLAVDGAFEGAAVVGAMEGTDWCM